MMNVATFQQQIKNNTLKQFYVFVGEEWQIQKYYVNQIAKVRGLETLYVDNIDTVYTAIKGKPLFGKSSLYVLRDDKTILTNEKLQNQLLDGSLLQNNMLILLLTSIDKRTRAFKVFNEVLVEFNKLPLEMLKKYVKREIELTDENIIKLLEICENDYGRALLEIDKIKQLGGDPNVTFKQLLSDGTIYIPPKDAIFDLIDAILKRDVYTTYQLLNECRNIGESNLVILSVLYDNAKQLLQVQTYEGNELERATGLNSWQINNAKTRLNYYTKEELINILETIQNVEKALKLGDMPQEIIIDYLLTNILQEV